MVSPWGGDRRSLAALLLLGGLAVGSLGLFPVLPAHGRLALYAAALAGFHGLEYLLTALHHPDSVSFQCTLPAGQAH